MITDSRKSLLNRKKKNCSCSRPAQISLIPQIITHDDGLTNLGVFWRVGLRKIINVYAALMTAVAVILIDPRMVGEINPVFLFSFLVAMTGMVLRSPDEQKISDSSVLGFILILLLKFETFIFHALISALVMGNKSWLGLRFSYVSIFFLVDFFCGFYLNRILLRSGH